MNIFKKIALWLTGAAKKVTEALGFGRDIANEIKQYADSPLLDLAVAVIPGSWDNMALMFVRSALPKWIEAMGWAEKKVKDFDSTTLPHVLNAIGAESAKLYADYKQIDLSRAQAITGIQPTYNPTIIN